MAITLKGDMKLKPDINRMWVAALREGEYPQTTGGLRDKDGFDVLGVLCDLHSRHGGAEWSEQANPNDPDSYMVYLRQSASLPFAVIEWAFEDFDPNSTNTKWTLTCSEEKISMMNDTGSTFKELADEIEREL